MSKKIPLLPFQAMKELQVTDTNGKQLLLPAGTYGVANFGYMWVLSHNQTTATGEISQAEFNRIKKERLLIEL